MSVFNTVKEWGGMAKFFHWTIGLLIIALLIVGIIMERMDVSPLKFQIYAVHKATGILVFSLVLLRIIWLALNRRPEELKSYTKLEHSVANIVHILLYIAMIGMPLSGWIMSSAANFPVSIFGLFTMPNLISPNEDLAGLMKQIHMICGYSLIVAVGLHVAGALKHHVIDKDITLRRMLPGYGSGMAIIMLLALVAFLGSAQLAQTPSSVSEAVEDTQLITEDAVIDGEEDTLPGDTPKWNIVPEQSSLTFTARQQGSEFTGTFGSFDGEILFDPENPEQSRIAIKIDLADVTTGSSDRDDQMTGPLWFAVENHPTALFKSKNIIRGEGDEHYIAKGQLTLKGITHALDLPFTLTFPEEDIAYAAGGAIINRLDYNVGDEQWRDTSSVGNEVKIQFTVQAVAAK